MSQPAPRTSPEPVPAHVTHLTRRGRPFDVLEALPRLDPAAATATVELPITVYWSGVPRRWDLSDPATRGEAYRLLLREGAAEDIARYVDGDLLLAAWDDMFLPEEIRQAWQPVIDATRGRR